MKKKLGKLVAMLLTTSLILGGCGSNNSKTANTNEPSTSTPTGVSEQVQEVSLTMAVNGVGPQTDPINWDETEVWSKIFDYIEENYGYRIKIDWVQYDADKINLMLVSGELADIIVTGGQETANTLVDSGYVINFNDYSNIAKNIYSDTFAQRNEVVAEMTGGDEKALYFLATGTGAESVDGGTALSRGYTVRWDWYKEIGSPEINSDEDYVNVLEAMVKNHPTTEAGETVYAYGLRSDSFKYWYQRAAFVGPAYMNFWTYDGYLYMDGLDDNVLYNGYTNTERSSYWQDMKFCWMLNQRGLFDQDSFTQSNDENKAKMAAGRYAGAYRPVGDLYSATVTEDENTLAGYVPVPSKNSFVFGNKLHLAGYFPDEYVCVSKKSKNIEAAVAFLDALHDMNNERMLASGIEGVHWDYDASGVPVLREETNTMINTGSDEKKIAGIGVNTIMFLQTETTAADGYPIAVQNIKSSRASQMNPLEKDVAETYNVTLPSEAFMQLVDSGDIIDHTTNYSQTVAIAREEMPSDVARILSKCNDIYYNRMPDLIMAKDWDEFLQIQAEMLAEIESIGEPEAWEWCKNAHEAARETVKPIYEEYLNNYLANK